MLIDSKVKGEQTEGGAITLLYFRKESMLKTVLTRLELLEDLTYTDIFLVSSLCCILLIFYCEVPQNSIIKSGVQYDHKPDHK